MDHRIDARKHVPSRKGAFPLVKREGRLLLLQSEGTAALPRRTTVADCALVPLGIVAISIERAVAVKDRVAAGLSVDLHRHR